MQTRSQVLSPTSHTRRETSSLSLSPSVGTFRIGENPGNEVVEGISFGKRVYCSQSDRGKQLAIFVMCLNRFSPRL